MSKRYKMKKMNKRITYSSLIALFLLLFLAGCKTSTKVAPVALGAYKSESEFIADIEEKAFDYETLMAKMNIELLLPGKNLTSRVDLKMIKDSVFQISVQPFLGIELFRAVISTDSIKLIDRMNKRYVAENYEQIKGQTRLEFNFYNLQALFTNQLFLPGQQTVTAKQFNKFRLNQDGDYAQLQTKDAMGILYTFITDGEVKVLSTTISDTRQKFALCWRYKDFKRTENQLFPMQMDLELFDGEASSGGGRFTFTKIQTNMPVKIETAIPSKYDRISINQIVKSLSNTDF